METDDRIMEAARLARTVAASPERVFEVWTAPAEVERWVCPDPDAPVKVAADLRAGGRYSIRMDAEGGPFTAHGRYREIDPPRRLVYSWRWLEDAHPMRARTLVTVEFAPVEGGTRIRLAHEGFPARSDLEGHEQGWRISLERLAEVVAGQRSPMGPAGRPCSGGLASGPPERRGPVRNASPRKCRDGVVD